MFSKTDREKKASANGAGGVKAAPSIISVNLHIIGNLSTDGEMQVDGSIEGDVTSQALTVGEKASISGEIVADHIEIHGSVSGKIRARKIKLAKTAKVIGEIWHEVLSIESGAYIEGQLKRPRKEPTRGRFRSRSKSKLHQFPSRQLRTHKVPLVSNQQCKPAITTTKRLLSNELPEVSHGPSLDFYVSSALAFREPYPFSHLMIF